MSMELLTCCKVKHDFFVFAPTFKIFSLYTFLTFCRNLDNDLKVAPKTIWLVLGLVSYACVFITCEVLYCGERSIVIFQNCIIYD